MIYKILLRDNINQRFLTLLNQNKKVYENNLLKCREAEEQLKCNIIFNGITTEKQDLIQIVKGV